MSNRELAGLIGLLAAANVALHQSRSPRAHRATDAVVTGAALALARRSGRDRDTLGLGTGSLGRGAAWGTAGALVVAAGIGAAMFVRSDVMLDDRPLAMPSRDAWQYVLVTIPLDTVLPEEIVFRGALPEMLGRDGAPAWARGLVSSLLFGLWHVLPFRELRQHNRSTSHVADRVGDGATLAAHTVAMTAAGGILYALRVKAGSVLAPALVHYAANALGFLGARWAGRHWPAA